MGRVVVFQFVGFGFDQNVGALLLAFIRKQKYIMYECLYIKYLYMYIYLISKYFIFYFSLYFFSYPHPYPPILKIIQTKLKIISFKIYPL